MGVVFDKLGFVRKLEGEEGFTRPQAERLTDAFYDAVVESVATKQDLGEVRAELKELRMEVGIARSEAKAETAAIRNEFRTEIAQLKVWVAGTGAVIVSALSALKFFH